MKSQVPHACHEREVLIKNLDKDSSGCGCREAELAYPELCMRMGEGFLKSGAIRAISLRNVPNIDGVQAIGELPSILWALGPY